MSRRQSAISFSGVSDEYYKDPDHGEDEETFDSEKNIRSHSSSMSSLRYDDIWSRLLLAADDQLKLNKSDAENIIEIIRKTLHADNVSRPREEIVASIIDQLGIGNSTEVADGHLLNYLTANYLPSHIEENHEVSLEIPHNSSVSSFSEEYESYQLLNEVMYLLIRST